MDWISELCRFFAKWLVQEAVQMDKLEALIRRECDIADELAVIVIQCDEIIHTDDHPFCDDPSCGCHDDEELVAQFLTGPMQAGLLTEEEATYLFYGKQV